MSEKAPCYFKPFNSRFDRHRVQRARCASAMHSRPSAGRRPGELFPRVGFLVTNLPFEPAQVFHFYNQRGTAKQYIKEGKMALKWSCKSMAQNEVRSFMPWPTTSACSSRLPIYPTRLPTGR